MLIYLFFALSNEIGAIPRMRDSLIFYTPQNSIMQWCSVCLHRCNALHWLSSAITFLWSKMMANISVHFPSRHLHHNSSDPTVYAISMFCPLIHLISLLPSSIFHFPMTEPPKWNPKNPPISTHASFLLHLCLSLSLVSYSPITETTSHNWEQKLKGHD